MGAVTTGTRRDLALTSDGSLGEVVVVVVVVTLLVGSSGVIGSAGVTGRVVGTGLMAMIPRGVGE